MSIRYIKGDATVPQAKGNKLIVHICNDLGRWGKGFVMAVSARWPHVREEYLKWCRERKDFVLGNVQIVEAQKDIWVANLIGQHGIKRGHANPVRYEAIKKGLQLITKVLQDDWTVHMPRIGCGLAGGKWEVVEPIVAEVLGKWEVTVYDYGD